MRPHPLRRPPSPCRPAHSLAAGRLARGRRRHGARRRPARPVSRGDPGSPPPSGRAAALPARLARNPMCFVFSLVDTSAPPHAKGPALPVRPPGPATDLAALRHATQRAGRLLGSHSAVGVGSQRYVRHRESSRSRLAAVAALSLGMAEPRALVAATQHPRAGLGSPAALDYVRPMCVEQRLPEVDHTHGGRAARAPSGCFQRHAVSSLAPRAGSPRLRRRRG
mmetsp:Transcript_41403/g.100507  ORF Transcript_41403/g.100507 Transcript_41403/m.100507 type:complete len:223 (+) Transcript_41403:3589-4257(+)